MFFNLIFYFKFLKNQLGYLMRPRYKAPFNRRYFHKKQIINKKDSAFLKAKIEVLNKKKIKKEFEKRRNILR